jgi:FkbM family methyltransferase
LHEAFKKLFVTPYHFFEKSLPSGISLALLILEETFFPPTAETVELKLLEGALRYGDNILEVGARTGATTRTLSLKVRETGLVIAAEPNPYAFKLLQRRVKGLSNVLAVNVALGEETGSFRLWIESAGDGGASITIRARGRPIGIDVMRADDLVAKLGIKKIDVLIIDVEGYEFKVLEGAPEVLAGVRVLSVEIHDFMDRGMAEKVDGLVSCLGFKKLRTEVESNDPFMTVSLYSK